MVLADGALLAALGVVIGVAGAILVTQWMSSLLYEGSPRDPMVLATLPLGLAAIAIGSCDFPARRAAKSDPVMVLRTD
jgi:ABC-type lipoprotein release transport system permease subunit